MSDQTSRSAPESRVVTADDIRDCLRDCTPHFVTPGGLKYWPAVDRFDRFMSGANAEIKTLAALAVEYADKLNQAEREREIFWEQSQSLRLALTFIKTYPNGVGSHAPGVVAAQALTTTALDTIAALDALAPFLPPQDGSKVARAAAIQRAPLEIGAEVLYEKWQAAEARARTLRKALERCADWPLELSRFELYRFVAAVIVADDLHGGEALAVKGNAALSSEDATRPTGDKE